MKKLYSLILVLFLISCIFFMISCQKILKEEPKSISAESFYNTAGEVQTAVNAIYLPLRNYNCLGFLYPAQENTYAGEYFHGRGSYNILSNFQGLNSTNVARVGLVWDQFYIGIRNANLVILNAPKGNLISEGDIAKYVGEAKFMRAFIYFQIVRNWNKAVLRTESNMTEHNVPLSSADSVYALIVRDLKYAEENLPDVPDVSGHPSLWSAKTVLADVYLYQGQYNDAMNKASEVISSGKYSLVEVNTYHDFDNIFGPTVVTSTEEIFYIKFSRAPGQGWSEVDFFHFPTDGYDNGAGLYAHYMPDSTICAFYQNQDKTDLRRKLWYSWDIGLGPRTLLLRKFNDPAQITGAGNDYPFYRYADLLLLYSEAVCRVNNGPNADAMEKLNMVHRRAYGRISTSPSDVDYKLADYSNSQNFLDLVLQERGYETVGEAKRWLDLKRLGLAQVKIGAAMGVVISQSHYLWPFPIDEMDFNTAIDPVKDQNPGY